MKNNAIIALITLLIVGAAVMIAQLISANGNGREPSADLSAPNYATQPPTTQPDQRHVSMQASGPAAKTDQAPGRKLADAAPQQHAATAAGTNDTTTPTPKPDGFATPTQPEKVLAQNSEASATEPAGGPAGDAANEQLIVSDAPPMDPKLYEAARWHPIHFKPAIDTATNEQCLTVTAKS